MLAIVGTKKHGKTTVTVRLAAELKRRGHRVMTIKHGTHTFNLDPSTTDTYRHYHEGGAERVAMASPDKFALVLRWSEELPPEEIAERYLADADIVLCEGFKASTLPRIEVWRPAVGGAPLYDAAAPSAAHYRAILTDDDAFTAGALPIIRFSNAAWLDELATLLERGVMARA
jgi:molybdopterin-guanine dinucleotide biosynthesis protein MobB